MFDWIRKKLGKAPPHEFTRGAAFGMFWAFTPTIGIQIPLIIGCWTVLNRYWRFNLPIALACTFVTNVFTMSPVYYLFLVTGRVLLGRYEELQGFEIFSERLAGATGGADLSLTSITQVMATIWDEFGVPLFVGCLPWAFGVSAVTYLLLSVVFYRMKLRRHR